MSIVRRLSKADVTPVTGDTIVTLTVDPDQPFERRIHLLGYAFIKVVQGTMLKQVLRYDLIAGVVQFIVAGEVCPPPRGQLHAELGGWGEDCSVSTAPADHAHAA